MIEQVTLKTEDGRVLAGVYDNAGGNALGIALLFHMMPATKESWIAFQEALATRGVASLAIDLRGHGASRTPDCDYQFFTDAEHQASRQDVLAALVFAMAQGFGKARAALVGASIGANLVLQALAQDHELSCGIALSAGENYRGLHAVPFAAALGAAQRVLLLAAEDDPNQSVLVHQAMRAVSPAQVELASWPTGGHGTNLFVSHPDALTSAADWLCTIFS